MQFQKIHHGANLIPEGLETGEFQVDGTAEFDELEPYYIVAYTGESLGNTTIDQSGNDYNGIASSITYIYANNTAGLRILLQIINNAGNGDKILTVFSIPKLALKNKIEEIEVDPNVNYYYYEIMDYNYKQSVVTKTLTSRPSSIDGYTPRNKKLLTYPYLYLGFNPPNGSQKIYRYENFSNATPQFDLISEINPNPSVYFIPKNYRGQSGDSLSDTASLNGYPTISYKNDVFNTWLAQNGEILNLQMQQEQYNYEIDVFKAGLKGGADIAGNAISGNIIGGLTAGANTGLNLASLDKNHEFYVKQQMAQIEKQKMLPDNASLSGSNATLLGYNKIDKNIFTRYSIKSQFAERIDKYFDMYGYTTNKIKVPNLNNRPNWNYIKLQGANILGNIPQQDLQQIKELFDNGITLWHNTSNFLDYSQNNR